MAKNNKKSTPQTGELITYHKNLLALSNFYPQLANYLAGIDKNEIFQVFMGKDSLDINFINSKTYAYMYEHPLSEVNEHILSFESNYKKYSALFFYGLGNGIFYKSILTNQAHKHIVVFESEPEIIFATLSIIDFSKEISDGRFVVLIPTMTTTKDLLHICRSKEFFRLSRVYQIHIYNSFYEKNYMDTIAATNTKIIEIMKTVAISQGNNPVDAIIGIKQTIKNYPQMIANIPLSKIRQRDGGTNTAIIVATGPSLNKQLNLLKEISQYATIICVDASYPILKSHGIKPDYVTCLERIESSSKFFATQADDFDKDIIFVANSLVHQTTTENLQNRQRAYVMRPLEFERGFDDLDFGYIGYGASTAHLAAELAIASGYKQIVLIGQDLAFGEDGQSHCVGHIFSVNHVDSSNSDIFATRYGGVGKIKTTKTWNLFRDLFDEIIEEANKFDIEFINSTEGGSRISSAKELPFKQICDELITKGKKKNLVKITPFNKEIQELHLQKAKKHLTKITQYGKHLQEKAQKVFLQLSKQLEAIEQGANSYEQLEKISKKAAKIMQETDTKDFHDSYFTICQQTIKVFESQFGMLEVKQASTKAEQNASLLKYSYLQREWLFQIAGLINSQIQAIDECAKQWYY